MARTNSLSPGCLVALARTWQRRLGLEEWPVSIRVADLQTEQPTVVTGGLIDLIILAPDATAWNIVETMLRYALHNVPTDQLPSDEQMNAAALDLVDLDWPEDEHGEAPAQHQASFSAEAAS